MKQKKLKTVKELLSTHGKAFNLIVYKDGEQVEDLIFNDSYVRFYLSHAYGFMSSIHAQTEAEFYECFHMWNLINVEEISRIYNALTVEYNPTENYDRIEEGSEKDTKTNTGRIENYNTSGVGENGVDEVKTTVFQTTEESSAERKTGASTVSGSTKAVTKFDNYKEENEHSFINRRTHGNIGVTSNVQLITSEVSMRTNMAIITAIMSMFRESELINV